jgi:tetratricopeptide (TPR) repeat protein
VDAEATVVTDDLTLRDELTDVDAARQRVRELESRGRRGDGERVVWLRRLGELAAAAELGWRELAARGGPPGDDEVIVLPLDAVAAAIRLGHVLQWQGRYVSAERLFGAAIATAASAGDGPRPRALHAFGLQHLGKCLYDQHRDAEALACFERALAMRRDAGAPADQVTSSEQAVAAACRRMGERPIHS